MKRWLLAVMLATAAPAAGQEFRTLLPIATPPPAREAGRGPRAAAPFVPVDPRLVDQAVRQLFEAWNTPRMRDLLGPDFYEATRLVDTLASELPRDAIIRVLAVEGQSTLAQTREEGRPGRPPMLVSVVSVVVRTQLEFNDPEAGFQRREGVNEYVFEVRGVAQ